MLILSEKNPDFPKQLTRLHLVPKQLYIEANDWPALTAMPMLAVVGTRKPTAYAASTCAQIVREIAARGVCIVSDLALGIDSIAHAAALEAGGKTIAVLPSGLDNVYPATHRQLAKDIVAAGGALVSEYTPKTRMAFNGNFIQRNRIIAGLSKAVFIPEAAAKSGSLHTAQFAIESGIDVCAMPGQVTNPLAEGCHNLIKSGAGVVTGADDVLAILKITPADHRQSIAAASAEEQVVLDLLASGIHDADELLAATEMPVHVFNQTLTMLELTGKITAAGGGNWTLRH